MCTHPKEKITSTCFCEIFPTKLFQHNTIVTSMIASVMSEEQDFSFPFPPYDIQTQFMVALIDALEGRKLGIFESPTGTGKSLSIICGALTWLEQHSDAYKASLQSLAEENIEVDDAKDWFSSATKRIDKENEKRRAKKELDKIERIEKRMKDLRLKKGHIKQKLHWCKKLDMSNKPDEVELNFNDENHHSSQSEDDLFSYESKFLLQDYTSEGEEDTHKSDSEEEKEDHGCLKIFYCSRTHTQLSQFVREVQKTRFRHNTRLVSLASRLNMCINDSVAKLPSLTMINERCVELQRDKKGVSTESNGDRCTKKRRRKTSSSGCPFSRQTNVHNLSDQVLLEVRDIEQVVDLGRKSKSCPYYAVRKAVKESQLVVLPYQCLLHRGTREACGIHLEGNVVIVDEAHNLLETLANIYSTRLSLQQVCCAEGQLSEYLRRYEKRLSAKNLLYIRQILFIIKAYRKLLSGESVLGVKGSCKAESGALSRLFQLQDFLFETLTDNLNLAKLVRFMEKSNIAHKLHGYKKFFEGEIKMNLTKVHSKETLSISSFLAKITSVKSGENVKESNENKSRKEKSSESFDPSQENGEEEVSLGSPLLGVLEFLRAITHGSSDGRIMATSAMDTKKAFLKYLLLNPASQFHDVVRQCRSVIVAGGTMTPMDEFKNQIFLAAGAAPDRLIGFSCSHVVAEENVLPLILTRGPGGVLMDFTFRNRSNTALLDDLGRALTNLCNVVPGGVVCFLPSYELEDAVNDHFEKNKVIDKIMLKKKVFREPKKSAQLEKVLGDYCSAVRTPDQEGRTGALLFSVVGGKMSEGINFSDDLGRCIIIVGMPYPNATLPELREKLDYLSMHYPCSDGKPAGTWYYENLCFKAVNQSIGRAIRHRSDYASILMVDHRYSLGSSQIRLPSWISPRVKVCDQFRQAFSSIRKFFLDKKENRSDRNASLDICSESAFRC